MILICMHMCRCEHDQVLWSYRGNDSPQGSKLLVSTYPKNMKVHGHWDHMGPIHVFNLVWGEKHGKKWKKKQNHRTKRQALFSRHTEDAKRSKPGSLEEPTGVYVLTTWDERCKSLNSNLKSHKLFHAKRRISCKKSLRSSGSPWEVQSVFRIIHHRPHPPTMSCWISHFHVPQHDMQMTVL